MCLFCAAKRSHLLTATALSRAILRGVCAKCRTPSELTADKFKFVAERKLIYLGREEGREERRVQSV